MMMTLSFPATNMRPLRRSVVVFVVVDRRNVVQPILIVDSQIGIFVSE